MTIEVVDDPQAEMEMDLLKETSNDWSLTSSEWLSHRDLFWPLFWEYTDPTEEEEEDDNLDIEDRGEEEEEEEDYTAEYDEEEVTLSGVGGNWDQRWSGQKNWIFKEKYNYGESSLPQPLTATLKIFCVHLTAPWAHAAIEGFGKVL